jgi:hypothetical protein
VKQRDVSGTVRHFDDSFGQEKIPRIQATLATVRLEWKS